MVNRKSFGRSKVDDVGLSTVVVVVAVVIYERDRKSKTMT